MSSPTILDPHPVADALVSLAVVADKLDVAESWQLSGQGLGDSLETFETLMRRFEFARLRLLAEFHAQDVAGQDAGLSTEAFLRARLRLSPGEARARVRSAQNWSAQ